MDRQTCQASKASQLFVPIKSNCLQIICIRQQNVGIPEFNQNHDNAGYATTNTVTRIVLTIDQDAENVSETSSVKRRVEARMK